MDCPSFFGETVPVISRAIGAIDDEDEEQIVTEADCTVTVRWSPAATQAMENSPDKCLACTVLFISIGEEASGFTQTYLLEGEETEIVAVMCSGAPDNITNTWSQQAPTDKTCFLRRLKNKPSVMFVQCNMSVSPYQAFSWTEQLFSCVNLTSTYVAVLGTQLSCHYRSESSHNDLPTPFLRSLRTSTFKGTPVAPYLEQPNVISGLPAQIMSYLEKEGISGVLYTVYKDVSYVDITTMKLFRQILTATPIKDFVIENAAADSQLVQLAELHKDRSTLYI